MMGKGSCVIIVIKKYSLYYWYVYFDKSIFTSEEIYRDDLMAIYHFKKWKSKE
tara:strand:- start:32112 stop:32270 length:159 start_codon:yes stop_codon:yes gene_type:complete